MPISYSVNERMNIVYTTFSGRVEEKTIVDHLVRFKNDRRIRDGYREIVDYRDAEYFDLSAEKLYSITFLEDHMDNLKSSKMAAVADSKLQFAIGRMYQIRSPKNTDRT